MPIIPFDPHKRRYSLTLDFMNGRIRKDQTILDLGAENRFSEILRNEGFKVLNTDIDLDREPEKRAGYPADSTFVHTSLVYLGKITSIMHPISAILPPFASGCK